MPHVPLRVGAGIRGGASPPTPGVRGLGGLSYIKSLLQGSKAASVSTLMCFRSVSQDARVCAGSRPILKAMACQSSPADLQMKWFFAVL